MWRLTGDGAVDDSAVFELDSDRLIVEFHQESAMRKSGRQFLVGDKQARKKQRKETASCTSLRHAAKRVLCLLHDGHATKGSNPAKSLCISTSSSPKSRRERATHRTSFMLGRKESS